MHSYYISGIDKTFETFREVINHINMFEISQTLGNWGLFGSVSGDEILRITICKTCCLIFR